MHDEAALLYDQAARAIAESRRLVDESRSLRSVAAMWIDVRSELRFFEFGNLHLQGRPDWPASDHRNEERPAAL